MEINKKTKLTTVKNQQYQDMLTHLDNAMQNWNSFSRLERLEYAYSCLELARNYNCSTRGVDPSKISCALEIMPSTGYCHSVQTENGSALTTTTLSVAHMLSAFKVSPITILRASLHESTHACDEILGIAQHFENAPMTHFKKGEEFLPPAYYKEISQNYRDFGIAWLGKEDEIRANEVGYSVTIDLLQDLTALHPENTFYQVHFNALKNQAQQQMTRQYQAEVELEQWKAELYQKYLPEGETSYPIINETFQIYDFEEPKHNFVTIETIRDVANQNEEMFKTQGYINTELQGLTTKAEVDAHPEIGQAFMQKQNTCVNTIGQALTPTTTMSFINSTATAEMTMS